MKTIQNSFNYLVDSFTSPRTMGVSILYLAQFLGTILVAMGYKKAYSIMPLTYYCDMVSSGITATSSFWGYFLLASILAFIFIPRKLTEEELVKQKAGEEAYKAKTKKQIFKEGSFLIVGIIVCMAVVQLSFFGMLFSGMYICDFLSDNFNIKGILPFIIVTLTQVAILGFLLFKAVVFLERRFSSKKEIKDQ